MLFRELRIRFLRGRGGWSASVERGKILRRLIIDDLRMVKRRLHDHPRLHSEEMAQADEDRSGDSVIKSGLKEPAPGQGAAYKDIGPEFAGLRMKFQWGEAPREKMIP